MFKTFLVPTDGSEDSIKAANAAVELAKQVDGRVVFLSVAESYPFPPISDSAYVGGSEAYEQRAFELAQQHVSKLTRLAAAAHVPCETAVANGINPHEEIVKAAQQYHCDAIFMATHGRRGLSRLFAGSVTQKVIAHSTVPVMVFR